MTHCRLPAEKSRSFWIEGSATFTIVASSTTMNCAKQTSTSTSQGLVLRAVRGDMSRLLGGRSGSFTPLIAQRRSGHSAYVRDVTRIGDRNVPATLLQRGRAKVHP